MRTWMIAAGAVACLAVTGCDKAGDAVSGSQVAADATAVAKKSLARMAPLYAGQEQVQSIESATAKAATGGGLDLAAKATTDGGGWTQAGFLPRVYAASPPDGIYEVDVVAQKPTSPGAAGPQPVTVESAWDKYKDGRVKGVKFMSKTNEVLAMVEPAAAKPAKK